ncbi:MAG: hypothetical protein JWP63_2273 [Candidatus Solibacter sp.]|jgi:hypothetical protein|nr:hypothetical protein [Candidatus Solibacter sp.]
MSTKSIKTMAGVLTLAGAGWFLATTMRAQPMYDRIHVNLPYKVTLQNKTIPPGDYTIQQLPSAAGDSRILLFYTNDGMKFETSAMTIPALDPNTARDTKVILNHVGDDYYISKIWVQGKDYGYELPVPDLFKGRQNERMSEATVAGTYQPSSSTDTTTATTTTTDTTANTAVATPPPAAATEPATATNTPSTPTPTETAQAAPPTPAPVDNSADRAVADPTPAPAPATDTTGSSDRSSMPSTAANWLTLLLSGTTLSGAGLMLRRKRAN